MSPATKKKQKRHLREDDTLIRVHAGLRAKFAETLDTPLPASMLALLAKLDARTAEPATNHRPVPDRGE